jgi:tetratricopeptide (TPR) repeat protein
MAMLSCQLLFGLSAEAQQLSVIYIEGQVSIKNGTAWDELSIGDSVSASAILRLDAEACARLSGGEVEIALTRPGLYQIRDIVVAHKAFSSGGVGATIDSVFRQLVIGTPVDKGSVSGARCAGFIEDGKDLLGSGRKKEAIEQLSRALELATESGTAQINYYLAYAYLEDGMLQKALEKTEGVRPSANELWVKDFVLLKARLLIECNAYAESVSWLTTNEAGALAQDAHRASLYDLLLGIAYCGAGDKEKAKLALQEVVNLSPKSELGNSAEVMLASL